MTTLSLSIINVRIDRERALAMGQIYINKNPDFQRNYDAWDDKLKTRFVETMLLGRAMNPIWTILNPEDNSEEILDGMHRITTATDFLNNEFKLNSKYLSDDNAGKKGYFKDLNFDDQQKIRNYNFIFNNLDSSYRTDINKRREMYEVLNRSSKTLNEFEFNKVLYNPFYDIISEYKDDFNNFFNKVDRRGEIEMEIISFICLSDDLNKKSWCSMNSLMNDYLKNTIGETEETITNFLENNVEEIKNKLNFILKIINKLTEKNIFSKNKKRFNKYFYPYKFVICRLCFKLKNISIFNRHIHDIIDDINKNILTVDIQADLDCKSRNAVFQKKLIYKIDTIIDEHYDKNDPTNNRLFDKKTIGEKLIQQENKCNICECDLTNIQYEGDHIIKWCNRGKTEWSNLQVLCKSCHQRKN